MKIAIVRQRYNPFGGAERFVERALSALVAQGGEVTLITRSWSGAPRDGFRQVIVNPPYSKWRQGRAGRDRRFAQAVQQHLAEAHYDIVQSHERIPGCMVFRAGDGVHAAWLADRAKILGPLGRLAQSVSPYHRYQLDTERAMFAHPNLRQVICNSRMVADEIHHFYGVDREKLAVIYNGVDPSVFHPQLADEFRALTRAKLGVSETTPVLLFVGSGFERKGVPQLLNALAAMSRRDAHLVIVGADRHLRSMQARAKSLGLGERVHFTGPLQDVRPWYGAADGFVLPTLYDPCPNAALEAMACGLPVVVSENCGAKEWVREGGNGWVVSPYDSQKLAEKLGLLTEWQGMPSPRLRASEAVSELTLGRMSQELLGAYQALHSAKSGCV